MTAHVAYIRVSSVDPHIAQQLTDAGIMLDKTITDHASTGEARHKNRNRIRFRFVDCFASQPLRQSFFILLSVKQGAFFDSFFFSSQVFHRLLMKRLCDQWVGEL